MAGYDRVFTIDPIGRNGGIALFWKNSLEVDVKFSDKNLLDVHVLFGSYGFFVSCVYGDPSENRKQYLWERLSRIGTNRRDNWCMFGDFNDILHNGDKIGGSDRSDSVYGHFNDMIQTCEMVELPSTGNSFTWAGKKYDLWIQSKLDRCFANKEWFRTFPVSNQAFLAKRESDHRPVLISLVDSKEIYKGSFRFDKRLLNKPLVK